LKFFTSIEEMDEADAQSEQQEQRQDYSCGDPAADD